MNDSLPPGTFYVLIFVDESGNPTRRKFGNNLAYLKAQATNWLKYHQETAHIYRWNGSCWEHVLTRDDSDPSVVQAMERILQEAREYENRTNTPGNVTERYDRFCGPVTVKRVDDRG